VARSQLEENLDRALKKLYPREPLICDWPIKVGKQTLYVDRVIMGPKIAVEADGRQHDIFVAHFHKDPEGFAKSKQRDALKAQWLESNGWTLVRFAHNEKITTALLRKKILKALNA
jgi:very-short-patch-repair endonuclease